MLAALAGIVFTVGCAEHITDSDIKLVPVAEVRKLTLRQAEKPQDKILVLIDPRAGARFDAAHLPGARNLKLPQMPERSSRDPSIAVYEHIIVYGTDPGSAAARAMTKRMISVGYKGVRMFAGGTSEWKAQGYPLEVTPPPAPEPAQPPDPEQ